MTYDWNNPDGLDESFQQYLFSEENYLDPGSTSEYVENKENITPMFTHMQAPSTPARYTIPTQQRVNDYSILNRHEPPELCHVETPPDSVDSRYQSGFKSDPHFHTGVHSYAGSPTPFPEDIKQEPNDGIEFNEFFAQSPLIQNIDGSDAINFEYPLEAHALQEVNPTTLNGNAYIQWPALVPPPMNIPQSKSPYMFDGSVDLAATAWPSDPRSPLAGLENLNQIPDRYHTNPPARTHPARRGRPVVNEAQHRSEVLNRKVVAGRVTKTTQAQQDEHTMGGQST
ncbi:hypothetical protein F4808DRAFT_468194 [Astrocystis sublimbata]|nr:hypothetical protein F4808DRAFT_468194 [Astrocystis sublimbata]